MTPFLEFLTAPRSRPYHLFVMAGISSDPAGPGGCAPRQRNLRRRLWRQHPLRDSAALAAAALVLLMGVLNGCAFLAREATTVYLNVNALFSAKEIEIEINKSFIEKYKDRVSIKATFTVDKAMQNPIAPMFDGDLHMAGRAPEIALPVVAEIANAASEKKATDLIHGAEGTGRPLKISGVWRIWPEHGGGVNRSRGSRSCHGIR